MNPLSAQSRPNRTGLVVLLVALAVAGLEIWGIGASLGSLLK